MNAGYYGEDPVLHYREGYPPSGDIGGVRRRVLVTGAAGFIGSHLVESLLAAGYHVTGVDNFDPWYSPDRKRANLRQALRHKRFQLHRNDLTDLDLTALFDEVDVVFHFAARPGVQDSWGSGFADACHLNIVLTQHVLEAAASSKVDRVVYASSSSVYGDGASSGSRAVDPISPYGVSKAAGEQLAGVYGRLGLDVVSLRFFTVFGPRQRPDMAMHRLLAATRDSAQPFHRRGSGLQRREFTYVGDVVAAAMAAGLSTNPDLCGKTLDVGGGGTASLNEVIEAIETITGLAPAVTNQTAAPGDPQLTEADIAPIGRLLGWRPSTSLRVGLRQQWYWQAAAVNQQAAAFAA